jgi:hypothetical protein
MNFIVDYMKAIDFLALGALVVIAGAAYYRSGSFWLLLAAVVMAAWGASRIFGLF